MKDHNTASVSVPFCGLWTLCKLGEDALSPSRWREGTVFQAFSNSLGCMSLSMTKQHVCGSPANSPLLWPAALVRCLFSAYTTLNAVWPLVVTVSVKSVSAVFYHSGHSCSYSVSVISMLKPWNNESSTTHAASSSKNHTAEQICLLHLRNIDFWRRSVYLFCKKSPNFLPKCLY